MWRFWKISCFSFEKKHLFPLKTTIEFWMFWEIFPFQSHSRANLLRLAILKNFRIFFVKPVYFFNKKTQVLIVFRNLTLSVAFYGRFATNWSGNNFTFRSVNKFAYVAWTQLANIGLKKCRKWPMWEQSDKVTIRPESSQFCWKFLRNCSNWAFLRFWVHSVVLRNCFAEALFCVLLILTLGQLRIEIHFLDLLFDSQLQFLVPWHHTCKYNFIKHQSNQTALCMISSWHHSRNITSFVHQKSVALKNDYTQNLIMTI